MNDNRPERNRVRRTPSQLARNVQYDGNEINKKKQNETKQSVLDLSSFKFQVVINNKIRSVDLIRINCQFRNESNRS